MFFNVLRQSWLNVAVTFKKLETVTKCSVNFCVRHWKVSWASQLKIPQVTIKLLSTLRKINTAGFFLLLHLRVDQWKILKKRRLSFLICMYIDLHSYWDGAGSLYNCALRVSVKHKDSSWLTIETIIMMITVAYCSPDISSIFIRIMRL